MANRSCSFRIAQSKLRQLVCQSYGYLKPMGEGCKDRTSGAALEAADGKGRVEVREGTTRQLTAARIYGLASDGKFYAPRDSFSRIGELGEHLFHTDGQFTLEVPLGTIQLEAVKGFEYWPAAQSVDVRPDETIQVTLTLRPMVDFVAKGWISGSTHVT